MRTEVEFRYEAVKKVSSALKHSLHICIALALIALLFEVLTFRIIVSLRDHPFADATAIVAEAAASDRNQKIITALQIVLNIASFILLLLWIFKSNKLARALGATNMRHSPGWSVGWFFVPIMNLVRPYFAVKEIYLATLSPHGFNSSKEADQQPETLNFVILWWVLWIADIFVSRAAFRYAATSEVIDDLVFSSKFTMVAEGLGIASLFATLAMVKHVWSTQQDAFGLRDRPKLEHYAAT